MLYLFQDSKVSTVTWTETLCFTWLTPTACHWVTPLCSPLLTASTPCRTLTSPPEGGEQTLCIAFGSLYLSAYSVPSTRTLRWLQSHCQGDMGTLWYIAIYNVHLHVNVKTLLPLMLYGPIVHTDCVCTILSDLSHYVRMLVIRLYLHLWMYIAVWVCICIYSYNVCMLINLNESINNGNVTVSIQYWVNIQGRLISHKDGVFMLRVKARSVHPRF